MRILIALVFGISLSFKLFAQPCKEVIAYYPNWQWYDRGNLIGPQEIDYSKYTIINYSFFSPQANGTINQTDSWADENLLFGQHDWVNGGYFPNTSIIDLAHLNGVRVLASIGGWTLSGNFPAIAANQVSRSTFAHECIELIRTFNFDGIDIDWEYPGYAPHNGSPADSTNFTLFLQEIRDSLDAHSFHQQQDYLLTSCFSADPIKADLIDWQSIVNIVDMINMMTYDFSGTYDSVSNHNSPLYAPAVGNSDWNLNATFNMLTQAYNVPSNMINLGVAFYGRSVTGCTGLHQSHSGSADMTTFWADEGTPLYYNILANMSLFTEYWDNQAEVPYLLGNSINTFVTFDNPESVALKAEYIRDNNARGAIIWELTGDYVETFSGSGVVAETPLADTLNSVFCQQAVSVFKVDYEECFRILQNPISSENSIRIEILKKEDAVIELIKIDGQVLETKNISRTENIIEFSLKPKGVYFIRFSNKNNIETKKVMILYL